MYRIAFVVIAGLCAAPPLHAASVLDPVMACTNEPDDGKRLACYDAALGRTRPGSATAMPAVPATGGVTTAGSAAANAPATVPPATSVRPPTATYIPSRIVVTSPDISASISKLTRRADGRYVIALSNGQVWIEAETKERFQADTGDAVVIRAEALGSHYLHTPQGSDIRVIPQK